MDDRPTGESDQIPATCPYRHELGPGRVLVGWSPCHCRGAGEGRGHRTYYCLACHELSDRRQTICYFPPHIPDQAGRDRTPPDGTGRFVRTERSRT